MWYQQNELFFKEWPYVQVGVIERQVDERGVQLSTNNIWYERRGASLADDGVDARMVTRHASE